MVAFNAGRRGMLEGSGPRTRTAFVLLVLAAILMPLVPSSAGPLSNQPSIFYFHKQTSKTINTITTTLWSNTTQLWSGSTQIEPRTAVKNAPAIWDFYSEPVMAGNATFTGPLTFTLFLASTGNTGTGTVITGTVSKVTSTGTVIPLAVASLSNSPISPTISVFTLTIVSNTYQIEAGSNLDFTLTVNIASKTSQTVTLYYDAPSYKSQVFVSFQSRVGTSSFSTYDNTGATSRFFSRNATLSNRQVTLRTMVYDAIGLYDIALVNTTILTPTGSTYLANTPLRLILGTSLNYTGTWSLNFTYATGDASGNYATNIGITDNSGVSFTQQLYYTLYATWTISLQTLSSDPLPSPVPGVIVTIYSSGSPVFSGVSNTSGDVVPGNVLLRDNSTYYVTSYWDGVLVNQTGTFALSASTILNLRLSAYSVDFGNSFKSGSGKPLSTSPSSFLLTSQVNGSITSPNPSGTYLLPAGTYTISSVIWNGIDVTPSAGVSFNPRTGTPSIDLQIYSLTVLAVDQNGQAMPNAQVTVTRNGQTIATGTTGNDGSLSLGSLPGGQYIIQVRSQSITTSSTISLTQDTSERVQIIPPTATPPASSSWLVQSWGWFVLVGAAVGGVLGYRQVSRSRLAYKEEPFDYLNSVTGGGLRDGDMILIIGDEATGKTTLCEEIAFKSMTKGNSVAFLTYEGVDGVRESMKRFRWDPTVWESKGQFQLIPCETTQGSDFSFGMVENFYGITALNLSMNNALEYAKTGKPVMIVDPLTSLAETASSSGLVNMLLEMSERIKKLQGQLFISIGRSIPRQALSKIEDASDGVFALTQVIENGKPGVELRVKKMRGRKFDTTPVRLRIDPKKGIVFEIKRTLAMKSKVSEVESVDGQSPARALKG